MTQGAGLAVLAIVGLVAVVLAADDKKMVAEQQCVVSDDEREHIRKVMLIGFEQSFQHYVGRLFDVWLKDATDQPVRGVTGINLSVNAYTRARNGILKWNPPLCK